MEYRPALADLPDHKGWRINPAGGYGPLDTFARGLIDLHKIRSRWEEILRVVVSIHTSAIRAYDVVTITTPEQSDRAERGRPFSRASAGRCRRARLDHCRDS